MANNYFQFRQFTVQQDHCAMKVSTDACIFGAYVAKQVSEREAGAGSILDIGTGTGLLALMMAQKTSGTIDAVEIDQAAFKQARDNFEGSPWKERLNVFNADVLQFHQEKRYDWIISNPPFFNNDLKSTNKERNVARHETSLSLEQLVVVISRHLSPQGYFGVLLPAHRARFFIEIAVVSGYFLHKQLTVQHTKKHPVFRKILFFGWCESNAEFIELIIKDEQGNYTASFTELMEDYYL